MFRAAVIGAAGYTGAELTRLLVEHPGFDPVALTSTKDAGTRVSEIYPALAGIDLAYEEPDIERIATLTDVAFLAVPHTAAMAHAPALLEAGLKVIDLSADFRLDDVTVFEDWYGTVHTAPDLIDRAVYGLPELFRDTLPGADLVACPGCYPTASLLAAAPAYSSGLASGKAVIDAKSGVSGAGRTPSAGTHYVSTNESVLPYKVASHRHTPEIAQGLAKMAGVEVPVVFSPHLVPTTRGLLATVYLDLGEDQSTSDAHAVYVDRYAEEPFVIVHEPGRMPSTREVTGSNRAHIGLTVDEPTGTLVVACAIDNLVKGASGQAVQAANVALGMDETAGLGGFGAVV